VEIIEKLTADAEKMRDVDMVAKEAIEARLALEAYINSKRGALSQHTLSSTNDKSDVIRLLDEAADWLQANTGLDKRAYEQQKRSTELRLQMLFDRECA
jgi:molecular chaperone DnaK (HSP70)